MIVDRESLANLRAMLENPQHKIDYNILSTEIRHPIVECIITNLESGMTVRRVGELFNESSETPLTDAYELSFLHAGAAMLGQVIVVDEDDKEEPGEEPEEEQNGSVIDPETVLLLGSMKGRKFGDVDGSPEFLQFLTNLKASPSFKFQNPDQQNQYELLLAYANSDDF